LNWTQLVNPNYVYLLPELIVVLTTLVVMVVDLYVKEKRSLVWVTLAGVLLALGGVWYSATDPTISKAIDAHTPLEFFGKMVVADGLSFFLKAVLVGVVAMIILLSVDYVEKFLKGMYLEFFEVVLVATLGMMFMVSSRDLITIYVGLELTSISSYVLAGLLRHDAKSNEAALKYFLNGALASAILLFGLSLIYGVTGTTHLQGIADALAAHVAQRPEFIPLIVTGMIFLAGGFAFKVAAVPMHLWAPDAYEGSPTPVTGFFSVGPKGAAMGAILRIFVLGFGAPQLTSRWTMIWAILSVASMFVGNITALLQSNIKRMMAYSAIAHAGYILSGVVAAGGIASGAGTAAVLYYVMGYALTNLGIFAVLTHMDQEGGWVTISDFNGLSQRNPVYAWALFICFISLIGIPPTVGFAGKFFLFQAAVGSGYVWIAICMAVNSVISVGYYYGVVKAMFLEKSEKPALPMSGGVLTTVIVSFVGVILVGILAGPFLGYAQMAGAILK
jgi:NADH-quinone oxidoreductase subunit N